MLLQLPNAGDDLQAIKKGVMELADLVVVNKADLDPAAAARAVGQIEGALRLASRPVGSEAGAAWQPAAWRLSALDRASVGAFWAELERFASLQRGSGRLDERRRRQSDAWLWERIDAGLRSRFRDAPAVRAALPDTVAAIRSGRLPVTVAARQLLGLFTGDPAVDATSAGGRR